MRRAGQYTEYGQAARGRHPAVQRRERPRRPASPAGRGRGQGREDYSVQGPVETGFVPARTIASRTTSDGTA